MVKAIGVDQETRFSPPDHQYALPLPVVFYGSSVCQGSGAVNPGQTYEAILCRELKLDFVNLGFGGAGKAETNVVDLVNAVPACAYVFDLGKSYGMQDATAFKAMLLTVRRSHPNTPIIAMTPITSVTEVNDPAYSERSVHTRTVMRDPVKELIKTGEKQLYLVEGEDLLGFKEHAALSKDGVHPSDQGYGIIAKRLSPVFKQELGL
jgi:lysophospholipase L1-like esterase